MKHVTRITLFLIIAVLAALAFPARVQAASLNEDKVVFGDSYRLGPNETLSGDLVVLGGAVTLAADSTVTGDVALMGGAIEINGNVDGNLSIIGGSATLGDSAVIHGDITSMGGTLRKSELTRVDGRIVEGNWSPFNFVFPKDVFQQPASWLNFTPVSNFFNYIGNALLLAALAMLLALFLPKPAERVSQAVMSQPFITGGLGLLSLVAVPVLLVLTAITIIGIPLTLIGTMLFVTAIVFGWLSLGIETGRRIGKALKLNWHDALLAGGGTLVLTLVADGVSKVVWCIGWVAPFLVVILGLGGVLITRFGTAHYTPAVSAPFASAPAAPALTEVPPESDIVSNNPPAPTDQANP
jgi:hypothetical protein